MEEPEGLAAGPSRRTLRAWPATQRAAGSTASSPDFVGDDAGLTGAAWLAGPAFETDDADSVVQVELVGRPLDETIRDWLASIGESWSQLTFFLFDPESWR